MSADDAADLVTRLCVTLECGHSFELASVEGLRDPAVGDFHACSNHSEIIGYDPQNGEAEYQRDQRIAAVEELADRSSHIGFVAADGCELQVFGHDDNRYVERDAAGVGDKDFDRALEEAEEFDEGESW